MAHDVFVSYSSKDKAVADSIVAELEKNNVRCWYAPRDIKPGDDWGEAIAQAISGSQVFLLIFSKNSNRSQRVLDELNLAISKEIVILPFRIEKLDPSGAMLLHLASRHWLDAFSPSWKVYLIALVNTVLTILEKNVEKDEKKEISQTTKPGFKKRWLIAGMLGIVLTGITLALFKGWFGSNLFSELNLMKNRTPSMTAVPSNTKILSTLTPTMTPTPSIGSTRVSQIDGMRLKYVPAGEFTMGITNGPFEIEGPAHQVNLDAFWIDKTEVTIGMYKLCVYQGACNEKEYEYTDPYPMTKASWEDARAYCEWAGRRLPTEAEWEKAAKGTDNRKYPWGNDTPTSQHVSASERSLLPAGSLPDGASPYGALDMAGNAWEWVADWYEPYSTNSQTNPTGPVVGTEKILRGGNWQTHEIFIRTTYRYKIDPMNYLWQEETNGVYPLGGFRCALSEEVTP